MSEATLHAPETDGDWLAGSRGFHVESASRRLGVVDEVRRDPESGRPKALVVRTRVLGSRVVVPVDEIAGVIPSRQLVVVQEPPPLAGTSA